MGQVGQQKIGSDLAFGAQCHPRGVGIDVAIVDEGAERPCARRLIVHAYACEMIAEDGWIGSAAAHGVEAVEEVAEIELQARDRPKGHRRRAGDKGRQVGRHAGGGEEIDRAADLERFADREPSKPLGRHVDRLQVLPETEIAEQLGALDAPHEHRGAALQIHLEWKADDPFLQSSTPIPVEAYVRVRTVGDHRAARRTPSILDVPVRSAGCRSAARNRGPWQTTGCDRCRRRCTAIAGSTDWR